MKNGCWLWLMGTAAGAAGLLLPAGPLDEARGQGRLPSHVPIPAEAGLKARPEEKLYLHQSRHLSPLEQRALAILRDRVRGGDPEVVNRLLEESLRRGQRQVDLQDPELRRILEDVQKRQDDPDPTVPKLAPQERRDLEDLKKQAENAPKQPPPADTSPRQDPTPPAPLPKDQPGPTPDQDPLVDRIDPETGDRNAEEQELRADLRRKLLDVVEKLDDVDGPLGKSRAWHEMLDDVTQHVVEGIGSGTSNGNDLEGKVGFLGRYVREVDRWSEPGRSALQRMHLENAIRSKMPRPGPAHGFAPSLGVPRLGGSSLPGTESLMALLWVAMGGIAAAILWQIISRRKGEGAQRAAARHKLGPWPIPPQQIMTREQLIRAFEYLALLCLGPAAQSRNHLEIAAALGGDETERRRAAAGLASIYEQARYAPADEPLADEALAAARRDLCFLAGVAAV
jgi:hypothetical protein